jgi:zinc D-Ala-D-Ala carboxypeptidase
MTALVSCPRCWGSRVDPMVRGDCQACHGAGVLPDEQLSDHFRLSELLYSETAARKRIANAPTLEQKDALRHLAVELLEPARAAAGCPIRITSGLRQEALNVAIGGSRTSVHRWGHAADTQPVGISLVEYCRRVVACGVAFDQLILEAGVWLHLGRLSPGGEQRRQLLQMWPVGGRVEYSPLDFDDPRVRALET